MKINRRHLIAGVAAVGAAQPVLAQTHDHGKSKKASTKLKSFDPSKEPKRIRKSFYDLTDAELRTFMKAVGYARSKLKLEDPIQWDNYARIHSFHCTEVSAEHPAVHWSWNFLPWHRAYVYFMERILAECLNRQGLDGSTFAMPYWDWSAHREIPNTNERKAKGIASPFFGYDPSLEDMINPDGLDFENSALYDGNRGPSILKPQMDPANELTSDSKEHVAATLWYTSEEYINNILSAPWPHFLGGTVTDRATGQGLLEQGPHNDMHDWIGTRFGTNRTMGTLRTAAADPMFYMHHCNIDRIWDLYKQQQPDPKGDWGKQVYEFPDIDGSTITMSVQQIIEEIKNISYAPSQSALVSAPRKLTAPTLHSLSLHKTVANESITVQLPAEFPATPVLLDITTGPINYTGKYKLRIYANGEFMGSLSFLDGEHRETYGAEMIHKFSLVVSPKFAGVKEIQLVPPSRGDVKILIKYIEYKSL